MEVVLWFSLKYVSIADKEMIVCNNLKYPVIGDRNGGKRSVTTSKWNALSETGEGATSNASSILEEDGVAISNNNTTCVGL